MKLCMVCAAKLLAVYMPDSCQSHCRASEAATETFILVKRERIASIPCPLALVHVSPWRVMGEYAL